MAIAQFPIDQPAPDPGVPASQLPTGRKDGVRLHLPVHSAVSRRRTPRGRRARNIHALIHINRQVMKPRIAQQIGRVRHRSQHILARKPLQTRNLPSLSTNRLQVPGKLVRLANPRRQC